MRRDVRYGFMPRLDVVLDSTKEYMITFQRTPSNEKTCAVRQDVDDWYAQLGVFFNIKYFHRWRLRKFIMRLHYFMRHLAKLERVAGGVPPTFRAEATFSLAEFNIGNVFAILRPFWEFVADFWSKNQIEHVNIKFITFADFLKNIAELQFSSSSILMSTSLGGKSASQLLNARGEKWCRHPASPPHSNLWGSWARMELNSSQIASHRNLTGKNLGNSNLVFKKSHA